LTKLKLGSQEHEQHTMWWDNTAYE
jgi:hypothetical protein